MAESQTTPSKESESTLLAAGLDRLEAGVRSLLARDIASRERITALEREVDTQERKLNAAEQQVKQVSEAANALQKRNDEMRRRLEGLEQSAGGTAMELERTRHDADARLAEVQSLADALAASQRQEEELHAAMESLRAERDTLRAASDEGTRMQQELDALREERAALRGERDEARATIEAAERESGSYAAMIAQRDEVIAAREEEINQLSAQAQHATEEIETLRRSLEDCRAELAALGERQETGALPLFSEEERALWTARIRELVDKLDRHLTV